MAIKKRTSKVSNGGRTKANKAHEAKRQAKFKAKRDAGKAYEYKSNPYKKGSNEWMRENEERKNKAKSSKLSYARLQSLFAKQDNELEKIALEKRKNK